MSARALALNHIWLYVLNSGSFTACARIRMMNDLFKSSDKTGGQAEGWSGLFRLRALPGNRWTIIECIFLAGNDN